VAAPRVEQRDGVGGQPRRDVELPVDGFAHLDAAGEEYAAAGDSRGVGGLADGEGRVRRWCRGVGGGSYCGDGGCGGHWGGVVGGHCGCCAVLPWVAWWVVTGLEDAEWDAAVGYGYANWCA